MSGLPPEQKTPKTQSAPSGSPPGPPKKTARGLDDNSPRDPRGDDVAQRLLVEITQRLNSTGLEVADRAKLEEDLQQIKEHLRNTGL